MSFPLVVTDHAEQRFAARCPFVRVLSRDERVAILATAARKGEKVGAAFEGQSHRLLEDHGLRFVIAVTHHEDRDVVTTVLTWSQFVANQQTFVRPRYHAKRAGRERRARARR